MLKFPVLRLWGIAYASKLILPNASGDDQTIYLVGNNFGHLGIALPRPTSSGPILKPSSPI